MLRQNVTVMKKTKIEKTQIVKDMVFRKILEDRDLRDILMKIAKIRDSGVCAFARRKSQRRVKNVDILNAIKAHTGWGDNEIFEDYEK